MPRWFAGRPLKAWRYVAFFSPELIVCLARVRIGPLPGDFWAVWDRDAGTLHRGSGLVRAVPGRAGVRALRTSVDILTTEEPGIETACPCGQGYSWTRKQAGVPARARVRLGQTTHELEGRAVIDDTAAYYPRHTLWHWSAGVGTAVDGASVAWNLVSGVGDPPVNSERTVWIDGHAREAPPSVFAPDLSAVDELRFAAEAVLHRRVNLGLVRSDYRQPIGTFSGHLPGGVELAHGFGVMERHDAWW